MDQAISTPDLDRRRMAAVERQRRYRQKHPGRDSALAAKRREADPDKQREIDRVKAVRWRANNPPGACNKYRPDGFYKEYYQKNRESIVAYQSKWKLARLESRAGRKKSDTCESCGITVVTVFDHCHVSGLFRGWLCSPCNLALGMLRDDPVRIENLMKYIVKVSNKS